MTFIHDQTHHMLVRIEDMGDAVKRPEGFAL